MNMLKDISALLITNPTNIRYLIGFAGVAPGEREAYCLVTKEKTFLFTNALYREEAKAIRGITFIEVSREEPFETKLADVLKKGVRLGFEETDLTVAEFHKIKPWLKNVELVTTQGHVEELRMIKREDEIESIRQAAKLADQCFSFILGKLKPGITEGKIAWEIESFIRARGAELAFSPIVAFGAHTSQPHYSILPSPSQSPTDNQSVALKSIVRLQGRALRPNDIILLDFGARVNGYCSDMTRMVFMGNPKGEWKRAYKVVLEAQQSALNYLHAQGRALSSQLSGKYADRIARQTITQAGFPAYPHSLGHGVGLDIHEAPRLTIKKNQILKPGMVVTVEPGIYIEGSYGIRIEDLIVLNKDGIDVLSKSKTETIIL